MTYTFSIDLETASRWVQQDLSGDQYTLDQVTVPSGTKP